VVDHRRFESYSRNRFVVINSKTADVSTLASFFTFKTKHMKTLISAIMYAAIVTTNDGCDLVKKYTGKEWSELPGGTKFFLIFAAFWGVAILILITDYLIYDKTEGRP